VCLAKAYLNKWDDEPVLQDIAHMRLHGGRVELETLLGEEKVVPSRLAKYILPALVYYWTSIIKKMSPDEGEVCRQLSTALHT